MAQPQAPERAHLQGPREGLDRPEEPELLKSRNIPWYCQAPERTQLQGSREGVGPLDFQAPERAQLTGPERGPSLQAPERGLDRPE